MFRQTHRQARPACVPNKMHYWNSQQPHPQAQKQSRPLQNGGYKLILRGWEHFWNGIKQAAFLWLIFAWTIAVSTSSSPSQVRAGQALWVKEHGHIWFQLHRPLQQAGNSPALPDSGALIAQSFTTAMKNAFLAVFLAWSGTEVL